MGFMTILHGDNRFYNNIFIQNAPCDEAATREALEREGHDNITVGTAVFDDYPTYDAWYSGFQVGKPLRNVFEWLEMHFDPLPVWAGGNAYFNGAKPYQHELDPLVDCEHTAIFRLKENGDTLTWETNLPELLSDCHAELITSDTLGKAFEPEQRFENPDGSNILFDTDYSGIRREGRILPGPFAGLREF